MFEDFLKGFNEAFNNNEKTYVLKEETTSIADVGLSLLSALPMLAVETVSDMLSAALDKMSDK